MRASDPGTADARPPDPPARHAPWWSLADRSIRVKLLAAFLFVSLLPLVLLAYLNDRAARRSLTQAANQSLRAVAQQTAAALDAFLETHLELVATEARHPVLAEHLSAHEEGKPVAPELSELLRGFRKRAQFIASYGLLDLHGVNIADSDPAGVGISEASKRYFQKIVMEKNASPHVSYVEFGEDDRPYLYLSAPVHDGHRVIGVLRARYDANVLQERIVSVGKNALRQSFAILFDENRTILAQGEIPGQKTNIRFKTVALPRSLVESLREQHRLPHWQAKTDPSALSLEAPDLQSGLARVGGPEPYFAAHLGRDDPSLYQGAVAPMEKEQWIVAFFQPHDVFLAPAREQTRITILLGFLLTGGAAALAVGVAQRLARPITRLTTVAQRVAAGELEAQAPVTTADEAGQLAVAFNSMTAQLRSLIRSLEERVAERERAEEALRRNEESLSTTLNSIGDAVIATDTHGRVVRMNPVAERLTGWPLEQALGHPLHEIFRIVNEESRLPVGSPVDQVLASGSVVGLANHTVLIARDGTERPIADSGAPIRSRDGAVEGVVLVFRDVTEERQAQDALRREHDLLQESEARFRLMIDQMPAFLWSNDRDLRFTLSLGSGLTTLRLAPNEMVGRTLFEYFQTHDSGFPAIDAARRALEGESVTYEQEWEGSIFQSYVEPLRDAAGVIVGSIGVALDITERKRFEAQLSHLANHDALTGLYNRHRFEEELKIQLSQANRYLVHGALLWCDLDQFKDINDSLGHRAGDELLIKVATSLREQVRETDILARPGGDEFAVLLPFTGRDEAQQIAARLLDGIRQNPVVAGGKPVRTTASIGIVLYPEHGATSEELLAHADVAMYQAKREGRNRFMVFSGDREWQAQLSSGMERIAHLREALEGDDFQLYLQPIVDIRTGRVARFELLLRLVTEDGRVLAPESFLGIAERFGLMRDIDRWVVARAIRLIGEQWRYGRELHLEVNLSGTAFADLEMLPWIQRELSAVGIDPAHLVLEITETAAVTDLNQASRFIETLKRLGCQFAVDDFGVGFSSFYYLKHLPVDLLKIDGSFIENLPHDPVNQNLVKAMVEMARGLGIQTVAEYVGDAETMAWLRDNGLDYAQGYYIGRPGPAWEVLEACYGPSPSAAVSEAAG